MVNDRLRMAGGEVAIGGRYSDGMTSFYLENGRALADVTELMRAYGESAGHEAAARADVSRVRGNFVRFCHWRQVERAIGVLRDQDVTGTVH